MLIAQVATVYLAPTRGTGRCLSRDHTKCPGDICVTLFRLRVKKKKKERSKAPVLHESPLSVQLHHRLQVLLDIREAVQHLVEVVPGQREALAVGQRLHRGQMFPFGQHARLCCAHRGEQQERG